MQFAWSLHGLLPYPIPCILSRQRNTRYGLTLGSHGYLWPVFVLVLLQEAAYSPVAEHAVFDHLVEPGRRVFDAHPAWFGPFSAPSASF
jgi:hypothetical protein